MSIGIIVRPQGYSRKNAGAPRFHPHFNRTMGKYYRTSSDYYGDLKSKGLEPYDPNAPDSGKRKPYKPSKDLRDVTRAIHDQTYHGKFMPSQNLIQKMESMGVKTKISSEDLKKLPAHYQQGGFN